MNFREVSPESEQAWLDMRTKVITATEVGILLGLNKWQSVAELVEKKANPVPLDNAYIWLGQVMEPVVVHATNKVLGTSFRLFDDGSRRFFMDEEIGLGATPDATDGDVLLECKTTKPGNYMRYRAWPPAYYLAQLYTQLMATGKQEGLLAILSTDMTQTSEELKIPISICRLRRSEEFDSLVLSTVKDFWDARKQDKMYRVNRKNAQLVELQLRFLSERVYG